MKAKYFYFLMFIGLFIGFISCEETVNEADPEGTLAIGLAINNDNPDLKSALDDTAYYEMYIAVISVINETGELVLQDEKIELYRFNGQFVSEEIRLPSGVYDLVRFLVMNTNGNVLFAAPVEGSPLAYLVYDPLPIHFRIVEKEKTLLNPEVLPTWNHSPEDFGYLSFGISIVRPLVFYAAAYMYYENPMIMAPSLITSAEMMVVADSTWRHWFKLEPKINRIIIRDGFPHYYIKVKKEGFVPFEKRFRREELKAHTRQNPLLFPLKYEFTDSTGVEPPDSTIIGPGNTLSSWNK